MLTKIRPQRKCAHCSECDGPCLIARRPMDVVCGSPASVAISCLSCETAGWECVFELAVDGQPALAPLWAVERRSRDPSLEDIACDVWFDPNEAMIDPLPPSHAL